MFTLQELKLIQAVTKDKRLGVSFDDAEIAASFMRKLIDNIADLEQREARAKAATQLRAVGNDSKPDNAA